MIMAGMDVVRLNFSHGTLREMDQKISLVRAINKKYHRSIQILGDLQGHRIRIGTVKMPMELKKNKIYWLTQKDIPASDDSFSFDYKGSLAVIKNKHMIFVDDGNIALEVVGRNSESLKVKAIVPGLLKEHKGVNIPDAKLDFGSMSKQDITDALFCKKQKVDLIAQSFVRSAKDILDLRAVLGGSPIKVVAKIENREGIKNIDAIIDVSDGVMVARGDMGVSLPIYEIPMMQKSIIKKCNKAKKFVITATQMLESMTENIRPTRAEATDVANAVIDGTDYVMLSAESAVGKHPVEAVTVMNSILKFTEGYLKKDKVL
jgi:pyruvate kinase